MENFNLQDFIKERNEALLSLDRQKIERYAEKYKVALPENEEVFWMAVHKCICQIFPEEVSRKSAEWLRDHGSSPDIF